MCFVFGFCDSPRRPGLFYWTLDIPTADADPRLFLWTLDLPFADPCLFIWTPKSPTADRCSYYWTADCSLGNFFVNFYLLVLPATTMADDPQPSTSSAGLVPPEDAATDATIDIYGDYVPRHLYSEEIAKMYNISRLVRELGTREQCINFAVENQLVPAEKICNIHRIPKKIVYYTNKNMGSFMCNKGSCRTKSKVSRGKGTWFENVKITLPRVFYLMYCYAHRKTYKEVIHEDPEKGEEGCLSMATVSDWYNYCRETVVIYQINKQETRGKIGGPGKVVQIDESKFGKRKYNKGRHVEGHWVLGLIEDGSEDLRLEICPDNIRSAEVLVPLIQKHVAEGTTIHTDYWRAYDCLGQHGFVHKKVNHSDPDNPFVAPDGTHTQRIESQWRVVKRFFHKDNYNHPANFGDFIIEYMWRRWVEKNKLDPFLKLIDCVREVYGSNQ